MLKKVRAYVDKYQMIRPGDRIVAGVSGGPDSVCLLLLLKTFCAEKGASLTAVHVNHCLRGGESDEDEVFVQELCGQQGVPLCCVSFDVAGRAEREKLSLEEAGRLCRYEAFRQEADRLGGGRIAVAHHAGDQAETLLFHLFRGSGIRGLAGMDPVRDGIIRPLLCVEREEIQTWLQEEGVPWRTDSTNAGTDYTRNRIRNEILPLAAEHINRQAVRHAAEAAAELGEVERFLERKTNEAYESCVRVEAGERLISQSGFQAQDPLIGDRVLRRCMEELGGLKDVDRVHIGMLRALFEKRTGSSVDLPNGRSARRDYAGIRIRRSVERERPEEGAAVVPGIPGSVILGGVRWDFTLEETEKNEIIPQKTYTKWFDYDKIKKCLEIRRRRPGDYLEINREHGRKKLKAYLIDEKVPAEQRDRLLLLADEDHIMWIPGYRISEAYKVTEDTKRILKVQISGGNEHG